MNQPGDPRRLNDDEAHQFGGLGIAVDEEIGEEGLQRLRGDPVDKAFFAPVMNGRQMVDQAIAEEIRMEISDDDGQAQKGEENRDDSAQDRSQGRRGGGLVRPRFRESAEKPVETPGSGGRRGQNRQGGGLRNDDMSQAQGNGENLDES